MKGSSQATCGRGAMAGHRQPLVAFTEAKIFSKVLRIATVAAVAATVRGKLSVLRLQLFLVTP